MTNNRRPATPTESEWAFALQECYVYLRKSDRDFAASLLGQLERTGGLTDKQWPYVERMASRAMDCASRIPGGIEVVSHVGNYLR